MAVSRAPKRKLAATAVAPEADERLVLEVIQRGGSVQADQTAVVTDELKNVQLRVYQSTLTEIDAARVRKAHGRRPSSRHAWILAAIEEKLKRER